MVFSFLATAVVVVHFAFIVSVVGGGVLVYRWPRFALVHLPTVLWAVLLELNGWTCPLTPLENWFRARAGEQGFQEGFIDHYLLRLIYPEVLTRDVQIVLGLGVLLINGMVYAALFKRRARREEQGFER